MVKVFPSAPLARSRLAPDYSVFLALQTRGRVARASNRTLVKSGTKELRSDHTSSAASGTES